MSIKIIYKNQLPHIAPVGAIFFVTFRLGDSLPVQLVKEMRIKMDASIKKLEQKKPYRYKLMIQKQRKIFFKNYDHQLDVFPYGECHLKDPIIANIVETKLHELDRKIYDLICYCIMPNHVHVLFDTSLQLTDEHNRILNQVPKNYIQLDQIMKNIKGSIAVKANRILNRNGKFWRKDSFDHYVRNEQELLNIINYILQNQVKAKLVEHWKDYPFTYLKKGYFG